MKKIEKLTPAQEATFPHYIDRWTKIGLSTDKIDRKKHDKAVAGVYKLAKLSPPKMIYTPCPMSGAKAAAIYNGMTDEDVAELQRAPHTNVVNLVVDAISRDVDFRVTVAVGAAVSDALEPSVGREIDALIQRVKPKYAYWLWGNQWAGYAAWGEFFKNECGVNVNQDCLDMMESGHYIWPFEGVCFASERPTMIHVDDQGQSHCETGPSVEYESGWGPYCWHGTVIPSEWITDKPPTAAEAITWYNMTQRRAACEMVGWVNILEGLNVKVLATHQSWKAGELVEVDIPDIGKEKYLRTTCGTRKIDALPVPQDMETVEQCQRWLNRTPDNISFIPELRT